MARLGELLVAAGQITAAQLDEGLRAQVLYGGRLGTNLVDLFHLDLDVIALALARQHRLPAALGKHFERCDLTVQARLTPALAERWGVVPIGHLADRRDLIAVAAMDPIAAEGKAELARALRCRPEDVIVSVAAELRIRYFLERGYGIVRASRYLRIRRETSHGVPTPPEIDLDSSDVAVEVDVDLDDTGEDPTIARPAVRSATEEDPTEDRQGTAPWPKLEPGDDSRDVDLQFEIDPEPPNALVQERRRRFVRTLSDSDDPIADFELTPGTPTPPIEPPAPAEPPPIAAPAPAPVEPSEPPPPR
ncbi:MAG: hypothetical protein K8W52_01960, partial [Deltaproteobacteria bacterium]|nr:hypothetical protein [Deltaproteobacteria bacterium]